MSDRETLTRIQRVARSKPVMRRLVCPICPPEDGGEIELVSGSYGCFCQHSFGKLADLAVGPEVKR